MWPRRKRISFSSDEGGVAMIEAAIVIPMLIFIMVGVMDFGLAYSDLTTAQQSIRNTGRYLSKLPSSRICTAIGNEGKNLAVYGKTSPGTSDLPLITGWAKSGTGNITIVAKEIASNDITATETTGCTASEPPYRRIVITATVPYTSIAWSVLGLPGSINLSAQHEERWIGQ